MSALIPKAVHNTGCLPIELVVTYPFHPFAGHLVPIVGHIEHAGTRHRDQARVKPWLREGITWQLGDASSPELLHLLEPQDIVVASNFLCHMEP